MNAQTNGSRRLLPAILILLVAGAGLVAFWQHRAMSALRAENRALRAATEEMDRLRQETAQIEQWRSMVEEVEKLRKDNLELNRLRNEIRQLRTQIPELEQLRTANQRLQAASQQLLSQKKAAESQLAQASAEHAAAQAAQAQAESTECVNRLKGIVLAGRMWANDHNEVFPPDFTTMSQALPNPSLLVCPSDLERAAVGSWSQFQPINTSYVLISPGAPTDNPTNIFVQCPLHGHVGLADGSVQPARPAP